MAGSDEQLDGAIDARVVLDTAHEAFIAMDEHGAVTEWNRAAELLLGRERDEVLGRELAELVVPPELQDRHREGLRRFLADGHGPVLDQRLELPAVHRDGSRIMVEITISAPRMGGRHFFHAFLHDIGDRIRRDAHRALQLAAAEVLAREPDPDAAIPAVLGRVCEALGWRYGGAWLVGQYHDELVQYRAWHDGSPRLAAFEVATRATSFVRGRGLPGTTWERSRSSWISDVAGDPGFVRSRYAERAGFEHACAVPLLADGLVVGVLEFFAPERQDEDRDLLATLEAIAGALAQYLQRKVAEREAVASKDAFVATVSHELRTPLTAIGGFASTIRDRHDTLDRQQVVEFADIIAQQSTRLGRIVDDLLSMSRLDAGALLPRPEAVDLETLARATLAQLGETDIPVVRHGDEPACALADPDLVRQVLVNLVSNAHRYGAPPIEVATGREGDWAWLVVRDHGGGIDPAFVPRLFEKFTRDDPSGLAPGGTGLGLSIVQSLVQLQGGEIRYEPAVPSGACFRVTLPGSVGAPASGTAEAG